MDKLFAPYLTEYKLGRPVLSPSGEQGRFDRLGVDAPRVFRHNGRFCMLYIGYDGVGYQTALAVSDDLLRWEELGVVLPRENKNVWDRVGRAGSCIMGDIDLYGSRELTKIDGRYWFWYHSYPSEGYEVGAAANGLAWTEDESLLSWQFSDKPVFSKGPDGAWDSGGLYSTWVFPYKDGYRMYYNGKENLHWPWHEQEGIAWSRDLLHWERYKGNPVFRVGQSGSWDCCFSCGQHVLWDSRCNRWVHFYCGYDGVHAQEGVAVSEDGIHWIKCPEPIIRNGRPGELDEQHAHKPGVIWHDGILYHFYCAVRPTHTPEEKERFGSEFRCITVARSKAW